MEVIKASGSRLRGFFGQAFTKGMDVRKVVIVLRRSRLFRQRSTKDAGNKKVDDKKVDTVLRGSRLRRFFCRGCNVEIDDQKVDKVLRRIELGLGISNFVLEAGIFVFTKTGHLVAGERIAWINCLIFSSLEIVLIIVRVGIDLSLSLGVHLLLYISSAACSLAELNSFHYSLAKPILPSWLPLCASAVALAYLGIEELYLEWKAKKALQLPITRSGGALEMATETMAVEAEADEIPEKSGEEDHQVSIWMRKPEDISNNEYAQFYMAMTKAKVEHMGVRHFVVHGELDFKAMLFIPKEGLSESDIINSRRVVIYAGGAYIMDHHVEGLMPLYLGFVRVAVDYSSGDLLRVLLQNRKLMFMRNILVSKCYELFSEIAQDKKEYIKFYEAHSDWLKYGIHEDPEKRGDIAQLLRYYSTKSGDEMTSLNEYVTRMKENVTGESHIYYVTGQSKLAAEKSPSLERLMRKGYEVLYVVEPTDEELTLFRLSEYAGMKFVSAASEALNLKDEHNPKEEKKVESDASEEEGLKVEDPKEEKVESDANEEEGLKVKDQKEVKDGEVGAASEEGLFKLKDEDNEKVAKIGEVGADEEKKEK